MYIFFLKTTPVLRVNTVAGEFTNIKTDTEKRTLRFSTAVSGSYKVLANVSLETTTQQ